jgi:hypothetical protein
MVVACLLPGRQSPGAWPAAAGRGRSLLPGLGALRGRTARSLIHTYSVPVTSPSPLGVSGWVVRFSHPLYHYPGWAMLITPSPLGVSGRAVRVSHPSCHYPGWAMLITPIPSG